MIVLTILVGAGITRYLGFTGLIHIREGQKSSTVISDEAYLRVQVLDDEATFKASRPFFLSGIRNPGKLLKVPTKTSPLRVHYLDHITQARPTVRAVHGGDPAIILVTSSAMGRDYYAFMGGESKWIGGQLFHFNKQASEGVRIRMDGDSLVFIAPHSVSLFSMTDQTKRDLAADTWHPFHPLRVYSFGNVSLVLSEYEPQGEVLALRTSEEEGSGRTALSLRLKTGSVSRDITVWGGKGIQGEPKQVSIAEKEVLLSYGSISRLLPFSLGQH